MHDSIEHFPDIRQANKGTCAQFFGVTLPTVEKWIREGMPVVQVGSRGISWIIDLHAAAKWKYEARLPSGSIDPETLPPAERKLWYDGETRRRDIQVRDFELIEEADYSEATSRAFSAVAQSMFSVRDLLERKTDLSIEQGDMVEEVIHGAMDGLRAALEKISSIPDVEAEDCPID